MHYVIIKTQMAKSPTEGTSPPLRLRPWESCWCRVQPEVGREAEPLWTPAPEKGHPSACPLTFMRLWDVSLSSSGTEGQGRFQVSLLKRWNLSSQKFQRQRTQHLLSEA